jgi:hypothetical protein
MVYKNITHLLTTQIHPIFITFNAYTAFYVIQIFQIKPNSSNLPQKKEFFIWPYRTFVASHDVTIALSELPWQFTA